MTTLSRRSFLKSAAIGSAGLIASRQLCAAGVPVGASNPNPPSHWDRVPVYAHVGKSSDDFTAAELNFLAGHFNLVTIEKGQAIKKYNQSEEGIYQAARQLKQLKPEMKVLFYWNSFIDYPLYAAREKVKPEWHLSDASGKPVLKTGRTPYYDLSRVEVREWWSDVAAEAMRKAPLDGIFVDALPQVLSPARSKSLGDEKAAALKNGLIDMLKLTRQKIGADKIVLANGLRAGEGSEILDWDVTGVMIEHFGHFGCEEKEKIAADLASMQQAAAKGISVVIKAWPGFSFIDPEMMKRPPAELAALARERITFPLACFLTAAGENCYFSYSWGYREDGGMFQEYPEFEKRLGPPMGPMRRDGRSYSRDFEHARVQANLEQHTATIDWL